MHKKCSIGVCLSSVLLFLTCASVLFLALPSVYAAENIVDVITIEVPSSCSMSASGTDSHTANVNNGQTTENIGTTNLKVICNDNSGYAIYAIGYTDDTYGKTVLTSSTLGSTHDITTATTVTTGTSSWAMKLASVSGTYVPIIAGSTGDSLKVTGDPDFSDYTAVPEEYTKVAYHTSSTDNGNNAAGSNLSTTYRAYISPSQPAGTYIGQVKYTLVHPNNTDSPVPENQIAINYDGNGLTFAGGETKNKVMYGSSCIPMYIATTPEVVETSNLTNGVQGGSYASDEHVLSTKPFTGASKVRVVVDYGLTDEASITVVDGSWDGWNDSDPTGMYYEINTWDEGGNISGTKTYTFDSDTVTIEMYSYNEPVSNTDYDYGMYTKFYPIYASEQTGTEETPICSYVSQAGTYATTSTWNGKWFMTINNETTWFTDEDEVIAYLEENLTNLLGTTITLYSYYPYKITYDGNGATAGSMNGFYTTLETNTADSTADLMAYNFKKTGYGFAGWSEDQNATINGNSRIYGPNEMITGADLTFNSNTRQATLYAVWVSSAGTMQNWSGCSSMNIGNVTALTDSRDSNVYTVGKLADGNCWMMENLRLDSGNSTNSSLAEGFGGVFTGLANSEDENFGYTSIANNLYSTSNITGRYPEIRFPRYNNNNTNIGGTNSAGTTLTVSPGLWDGSNHDDDQIYLSNSDHAQWYGYGNYYTWAAAMANTTSYSDYTSDNTATSICPAGWQLPYGRNTGNGVTPGGFSYLDLELGGTGNSQYNDVGVEIVSNRWRRYPNNFIYAGMFNTNSAGSRGKSGYYWSKTASTLTAYHLVLFSNIINPGTSFTNSYNGYSVRCLAKLPS